MGGCPSRSTFSDRNPTLGGQNSVRGLTHRNRVGKHILDRVYCNADRWPYDLTLTLTPATFRSSTRLWRFASLATLWFRKTARKTVSSSSARNGNRPVVGSRAIKSARRAKALTVAGARSSARAFLSGSLP